MKNRKTISLISKIKDASYAMITRELEQHGIMGISPSHGGILVCLFLHHTALSMKEVARKIHKTQPTVTVLVDKLIEAGYVSRERCTRDCRVSYIQLTEKGKSIREVFFEISQRVNQDLHQGFTELEAEMLEKLLEKMAANL